MKVEAARQRAAKLMTEGVPPAENRAAALELRRAELALKVKNKIRSRGSVLRIVDDSDQE